MMSLNNLIKLDPPLDADGMITIYEIDTGEVVAQYEGLDIHRIFVFLKKSPNPDCKVCLGEGEFYWHSSDCDNDDCILAAGYWDCKGEMTQCACSLLDKINANMQ